MKRALPLVAICGGLLLATGLAVAIGVDTAWKRAGRRAWPMDLGTLEDVPGRFPKRGAGAAALRLAELAKPFGGEGEPVTAFLYAEHERNTIEIGAPPAALTECLAANETRLDAIREHILRGGDFGWAVDLEAGVDAPVPDLPMHSAVVRTLVARALVRRDWDDLRAAFLLARSLEPRPEVVSQVMEVELERTVNAAAWKLPLPAPFWVVELRGGDRRRDFLRAFMVQTWLNWQHANNSILLPVARQYARAAAANFALHQRATAVGLVNRQECGFDATRYFEERIRRMPDWNFAGQLTMPNYGAVWSRVLKLDVEREATANALRVRAGQPVDPGSRCSDGTWRYADGRLRYTAELPRVTGNEMPLTLVISAP